MEAEITFESSRKESIRISTIAFCSLLIAAIFKFEAIIKLNKGFLVGILVLTVYLVWNIISPRVVKVRINKGKELKIYRRSLFKINETLIDLNKASVELKNKVSGQGFKYSELRVESDTGVYTLTGGKGGWKNSQVEQIYELIT